MESRRGSVASLTPVTSTTAAPGNIVTDASEQTPITSERDLRYVSYPSVSSKDVSRTKYLSGRAKEFAISHTNDAKRAGLVAGSAVLSSFAALGVFSETYQNTLTNTVKSIFNNMSDDTAALMTKIFSGVAIALLFLAVSFVLCKLQKAPEPKMLYASGTEPCRGGSSAIRYA